MSTHAHPETRHASAAETTPEPDVESDAPVDDDPRTSFDAHDPAATFDAENARRLPNTVDHENEYVG